jgi:hypothetical protein
MEGILPEPLARYPLNPGLAVAVQVKVVLARLESKLTGVVNVPAQISCERTVFVIRGIGYTVTTRFIGVPRQAAGAGPEGVIT